MNEKFNRMHDNWLQSGNPADEPEGPDCNICGNCLEYEEDFDMDEETGRVYRSGGSWHCTNEHCGETAQEEEQDE